MQSATASIIQNSLAAGEIAPGLYGRTDLAKFHQSALLMKNWFVDYKGGASTRPGTQLLGTEATYTRLWPFKFSAAIGQTYILVLTNLLLEFVKNPGGVSYPNSSNSGFIQSMGSNYSIVTPYVTADLPHLKFSQLADTLVITHPSYPRYKLVRVADTNWTLTLVAPATGPAQPTISSIVVSPLPSGSTDPQHTQYIYGVSAVDSSGIEGPISLPVISSSGINIATTLGTVTIYWGAIATAAYYKVYKGLSTSGNVIPSFSQPLGFCGYSYGTSFNDSNIVPDFAQSPLTPGDPFAVGALTGYNISSPGASYPLVGTTITVTGGGGTGAVIFPVFDSNITGGTGSIVGLYIYNPGHGYTSPPTIAAVGSGGSGFVGTVTIGPQSGTYPGVVGLFQQRQVYARTNNKPNSIFGSRPRVLADFRTSNPINDGDSWEFDIASPDVNEILWVRSMPGGLVIGTDSGIVQLTGGSSSVSNPAAVTPQSGIIVPQSYYGSADIAPLVIDSDILYVQSEGSNVSDLQYNYFTNIYSGEDITIFSSHFFYPRTIVDWGYQNSPFKVIWCLMSDGNMLSLTFLKKQEIIGWAQHLSPGGSYESMAVVQEGPVDAVYFSVNRGGKRFIERLCDRLYDQRDDAWCLDAGLSIVPMYPTATLSLSGTTAGLTVVATAGSAIFSPSTVGSKIRYKSGKGTVTTYVSTTIVNVHIDYDFPASSYDSGTWRLDPLLTTVSGLASLNGFTVYALVDGVQQGPFTVSGGAITLTTPGTSIVVGILYNCQLYPVYADISGEMTIQGRRKKIAGCTIRVKDTARLRYGPDFSNLKEYIQGVSGTDPVEGLPYAASGLATGDQRLILNASFNRVGSVAIEQDYCLPATVLAIIPEIEIGDTR